MAISSGYPWGGSRVVGARRVGGQAVRRLHQRCSGHEGVAELVEKLRLGKALSSVASKHTDSVGGVGSASELVGIVVSPDVAPASALGRPAMARARAFLRATATMRRCRVGSVLTPQ